jgi:hypothetical protein
MSDAPRIARLKIPRPHSSLAASHLCVILSAAKNPGFFFFAVCP